MSRFVKWGLIALLFLAVIYAVSRHDRYGCASSEKCPDDLVSAAGNASWAKARIASLSEKGGADALLFTDADQSGRAIEKGDGTDYDKARSYARQYLSLKGISADEPAGHQVAEYVETKAATYMRENDIEFGVLVASSSRAGCAKASGVGCRAMSAGILPRGSTLVVWSPAAHDTVHGTATGG
ncbi:DddA-like double-stranded DNA deaminase toxin [Sciscionella sediminilitoris]|uniref:DddA-like double-stranded DNA deaminase toxin n=1 Tax=Sciscionella sediminilitoris TaxID=1445613 RepID=UPI0004DF3E05|nr:DddA-like double-stranded DNA deaminase toxin [Sciscionella sp. SE31]